MTTAVASPTTTDLLRPHWPNVSVGLLRLSLACYEAAVAPLDQTSDVSDAWGCALASCLEAMFEATPDLAGTDWLTVARDYLSEV
jgi:hypothetical protein